MVDSAEVTVDAVQMKLSEQPFAMSLYRGSETMPSSANEVERQALLAAWQGSADALVRDKPRMSSNEVWPYRFDRVLRRFDGANAGLLLEQAEKESSEIVVGTNYLLKKGIILIFVSLTMCIYGILSGKNIWILPGIAFWYVGITSARKANISRIRAKDDLRFAADVRRFAEQVQTERVRKCPL